MTHLRTGDPIGDWFERSKMIRLGTGLNSPKWYDLNLSPIGTK